MADESTVIRGISWRDAFPFTNIFRAFRIAIHPSKLALALAALLLMYGGGRILDAVWPQSAIHEGIAARGSGPFIAFLTDEARQVNLLAAHVLSGDWLFGRGVLGDLATFCFWNPWGYLQAQPLFFTLLFLWFLLVWAVFGGAIARIAAVHVARDEKLSVRQALRFSISKLLSFVFAPLIPLAIVLAIGVALALGGLLLYVPWIGPVLVGLLFFLALGAGLLMTLLVLGTAGGFNLMYPTVAVEGSDSFDAISRSFSYVYARPWRMLWYTLVAVVYGALTYLFVRLFLFVMLALTHYFVAWWVANSGQRWDVMWPGPSSFWSLPYELNFSAETMGSGQKIGAGLLAFWIYMTIALLGAFLISFYFSANTIIYYLMRQEVDATEMDDVYLEQSDEEFAEPTPAPATAASPASPGGLEPVTAAAPAASSSSAGVAPESGVSASDAAPPPPPPPPPADQPTA